MRDLEEQWYSRLSRDTRAFLRVKLDKLLTRNVAPHIFETEAESRAFLGAYGAEAS